VHAASDRQKRKPHEQTNKPPRFRCSSANANWLHDAQRWRCTARSPRREAAICGCVSVTSNLLCFLDKTIGNNVKLTAPIEVELVMLVLLSFGNAAL